MPRLFTPRINWKAGPFRDEIAHRTAILASETDDEQRVQMLTIPRRRWRYSVTALDVHDSGPSGLFDALQIGAPVDEWAVPYWPHVTGLTADVTAGSSVSLPVEDTTDRDFEVGGLAAVIRDDGTAELVEVTDVAAQAIEVATLAGNWAAGDTVVPCRLAIWLPDAWAPGRLAAAMQTTEIAFELQGLTDPGVTTPAASVFSAARLSRRLGEPLDRLARSIYRLDNPTGIVTDYARGGAGGRGLDWLAVMESPGDVADLIEWYYGAKGALTAFYLPTYQADLDPVEEIEAADTALTVRACHYTALLFPLELYRSVCLVHPDGTTNRRRITNAVDNGDGTETLTLSAAAGVDLPLGTGLVSFALYCRLAADPLEVTWIAPDYAEARLAVLALPNELLPGGGVASGFSPASPSFSRGSRPPVEPDDPPDPTDPDTEPTLPDQPILQFPSTGTVGVALQLRVIAYDANGVRSTDSAHTVAISITGASSATPAVTNNGDGTWSASWPPAAEGSHSVAVTMDGTPIAGSPFTIVVAAATVDAASSTGSWQNVDEGEPRRFVVQGRDSSGRALANAFTPVPVFEITGDNPATPTARYVGSGRYEFVDTPDVDGSDAGDCTIGGVAISGSPFASTVTDPPVAPTAPGVPTGLSLIVDYTPTIALPKDKWVTGSPYGFAAGGGFDSVDAGGASAGVFTIPVPGRDGAGSGGLTLWPNSGGTPEFDELYFILLCRLGAASGAANYENHPVGTKLGFIAYGERGKANNQGILWLDGTGAQVIDNEFPIEIRQQNFINRNLVQNENLSTLMQMGVDQTIAGYLKLNTIGSANGIARVWLGSTRVINYSDVVWRTASFPAGFFSISDHVVWGGNMATDPVKTRSDLFKVKRHRIYGRRIAA